jgi:hypothetical protein
MPSLSLHALTRALVFSTCTLFQSLAFAPHSPIQQRVARVFSNPPQSTTPSDKDELSAKIDRTSFDDAGRSLIEEEDRIRMEQMGDYDLNPDVSKTNYT